MTLVGIGGIVLVTMAVSLSSLLARFFVGYDANLMAMTSHGFRLYALAFLINGFNIYGSSFFTALNNGLISAAISFFRTLVFQTVMLVVLPMILGLDGIWLAIVAAETLALIVTIQFLVRKRNVYHYG